MNIHTPTSNDYTPGMCNINTKEVNHRRLIGHICLAMSLVAVAMLFYFKPHFFIQLTIFIPIFFTALGYLQAKNTFCVAYAFSGKHHTTDKIIEAISDNNAKRADFLRGRMMLAQAFIIATAVTAITCTFSYFMT